MGRSAEAVLRDHLDRREHGDLEGDLRANYAEDVIVLSKEGVFRGHEGVRAAAANLHRSLPDARYSYDLVRVCEEIGLLGWSARAATGARTCQGVDSFVIRDGLIRAQTIHYDVAGPPDGQKG